MKTKVKIYTGLSLTAELVKHHFPEALISAPIRAGDLVKDLKDGIHIVGIIDGTFNQNAAISPGEIVDAMRCGLKIFGAASMGALRAVELEEFGMTGVGEIFEYVRSQPTFRDDTFGQVYYEGHEAQASTPFIDVYMTLLKMRDSRLLSKAACSKLIATGLKIHYSKFSIDLFLKSASHEGIVLGKDALRKIRTTPSQKKSDALRLLNVIRNYKNDVSHFHETF